MSDSPLLLPAAHVLSFGVLLGTQTFQSFINGIVAYRALPRPQFSVLQQKLFPIYFGLQTALPAVMALTYPGMRSTIPSSIQGVLAESNRISTLTPLALIFVTSAANMLAVGPATTKIMKERKRRETIDGKKSYDPAPHTKEMQQLNRAFGRMHGISSLLNLVGIIATCWYGVTLAGRIA